MAQLGDFPSRRAEGETLAGGFTVAGGAPVLLSISPTIGLQGQQNVSVNVTGQFTSWVQGTTTASFGAGITVATLTVNTSTSATAVISIDPAAATGTRTVLLTTGAEIDTLSNAFLVAPPGGNTVYVTFSALNTVNPGQEQSTPEVASVALSFLNTVNPAQEQATPEQPSVTLSFLNTINPAQQQSTPEVPSVTLSFLNLISPGLNQQSYFDAFVIFSALNGSSQQQQSSSNLLSNFTYLNASGERVHWDGPVSLMTLRMLGPTVEARRRLMAGFTGPDSDGDGLPDAIEIMFGSNPYNADSDGDGLPDGLEYLLKGDPFSARPQDDDDGDGLTNIEEVHLGTDASKADTDGDGLSDGEEVLRYHTDPLRMDTDGDGFPDGLEVALGTDPLDPRSFPSPRQLVPPTIFSVPLTIFNGKSDQIAAAKAPHENIAKQGVQYARKE